MDNGNETAARRPRANLRPFPLLNPLTFHPTSCTSHSPLSLPPLLTPPDGNPVRRDAITCLLQTNTYQALSATHPLPSSSPSSSPSFSLRCCGSSPSTQSARKLKKKKRKIMKIHGRSCNIYSYKPIIVVESKRSFSPHT